MSTGEESPISLTEEESRIIKNKLEIIEHRLFTNTIKKIKNYLIILLIVLTGAGIVTFTNIKSNIEESVITKLVDDKDLKKDITDRVEVNIEDINSLKIKANELVRSIERERTSANIILQNNMDDIISMLEKIDSLSYKEK